MSASPHCDVVVIGGGLVGACLAEELAGSGATVIVLDAGAAPGHATPLAAGVAVPSLRYLGDEAFYGWLLAARAALDDDLARLEPEHGRFSLARPVLRLLREVDLAALAGAERSDAAGEPATAQELARLAPGLALPADRTPYLARDGLSVDGRAYLHAVRAAALRAGVGWRQDRTVTAIEDGAGRVDVRCCDGAVIGADRAVVTAGAWTGRLVGTAVVPQRGQLVLLDAPAPQLGAIVSARLYLAPLPDGRLLIGATEEEAGFDDRCTAGSVAGVLAFGLRLFPQLATATVLETRAGLRPVSASGRPVVGRVPGRERVYVASGHAGYGLVSARATARGMAAGLSSGHWDALPEDFCPAGAVAAGTGV